MAEKKPVQQAVPTEAETDAHVDDLVNKALKALEEFDNGEIHKEWKERFGKYIMNKIIFDCE